MKTKRLMILFMIILMVVPLFMVGAGGKQEGPERLKFGYISKMLTHPWFIEESQGIADKSAELGVDYVAIDANLDDEAFMAAVETMITQRIDGLMFCITDPQLGPVVVDLARAAGIPVMTIDDNIVDSDNQPVPHVGMPTTEVGYQGGEALANIARERGFFQAGNNVKVMSVTVSSSTFLLERTQGYHDALRKYAPEIPAANYIQADNRTGMFEDVLPVAAAILNAHPDATHWLVTGINDDSALAPLRVFEEAGFPLDRVLACGLGGYKTSYEEFQKSHNSYIVNKTQPYEQGRIAAQLMYDHLTKGVPLPLITYVPGTVVTKETHKDFEWNM
jgi:L-arabinose transport system substrate-binding protein